MQTSEAQILDVSLMALSVQEAIVELADALEVDHVTYHMVRTGGGAVNNPFVRTTYPSAWVCHYLLNNLVLVDPVLRRAMESEEPFHWDELVPTPEQSDMLAAAVSFGLGGCGYSVPCVDSLGRRSVMSLNRAGAADEWRRYTVGWAETFRSVARDLHVKALGEAFAESGGTRTLSPRELECLRWTAAGKTYSEIATILALSEHTIRSYLKDARLKLDAVSLAQAVAKASNIGLV